MKLLFDATYSPNTELARREMSKSVFVAPTPLDIRVFTYHSVYEIADKASLIMCERDISYAEALREATIELTGLLPEEYSQKIDELFLAKKESHKEMKMIWENFNFPIPEIELSDLPNHYTTDISTYHPKSMLKRGTKYVQKKAIYNLRELLHEETFFSFDDIELFCTKAQQMLEVEDALIFLEYLRFTSQKKKNAKKKNKNISDKIAQRAARAINLLDSQESEFILLVQTLFCDEEIQEEFFAQKLLFTFRNFQKKLKEYELKNHNSSVLYYGRYAKDFINLYENNFFQHPTKHDNNLKFGVSIWAELITQGSQKCTNSGVTQSSLKVFFAKSYVDGSYESIATLTFEYTIFAYKNENTKEMIFSKNSDILAATKEKIYNVISEQYYPLFGLTKEDGIGELTEQFTLDEGERGGVLNLKDINISTKYSDRIIPELIKGVYDLIDFNSSSSFPLFACMVGGDIIVNDELFPVIKSPLFTLISCEYLRKRVDMITSSEAEQNATHGDFFSEYHSNAYHYYNRMTFDPLRPIFVY